MAMNIDAGPVPSYGRTATRIWLTSLLPWLGVAALFVAAMAMRHVVAANTDVSWLLIAGERWLDGQRLYSDIVETNPPMDWRFRSSRISSSRYCAVSVWPLCI